MDLKSLSELVKLPKNEGAASLSWLLKLCPRSVFAHTNLISHMAPVLQLYGLLSPWKILHFLQ